MNQAHLVVLYKSSDRAIKEVRICSEWEYKSIIKDGKFHDWLTTRDSETYLESKRQIVSLLRDTQSEYHKYLRFLTSDSVDRDSLSIDDQELWLKDLLFERQIHELIVERGLDFITGTMIKYLFNLEKPQSFDVLARVKVLLEKKINQRKPTEIKDV